MSDDAAPSTGMNIVTKTGSLLAALAEQGECSPATLATILDEPMSSVYRLISNLEAIDWVERGSARGRVRLGLAFLKIGRSLERQFDIRRLALPQLHALSASTGESTFLCIRRGWNAVCIERIEGQQVMSLTLRLGESLPLHKSAVSRAVLAFEPPKVIDAFLAAARDGSNPTLSDVDPDLLGSQLRAIVAAGTSFSDSDVNPGIAAIGAPVFNHRGEVVAALSASGRRAGILERVASITAQTRGAADLVSSALGYVPAAIQTELSAAS